MKDRYRPVPQSRLGRLAAFGQLAGGIATGALSEGLSRLAQGERPHLRDLLLTPSNARRVTDQLSRLRGAAMKLGQMLSLDPGDVLPPELTAILGQLRDAAHFVPEGQLRSVLATAWGPHWQRHFSRFDMTPIAAASIGQVHKAVLVSGREVAVKVQYPGIAASIDADIDNVATLLRISGILPAGLDIKAHLAEAKRQLHEEADYLREAEQMRQYRRLLTDDPRFVLPEPVDELLHPTILVMDYIKGLSIETIRTAPPTTRNEAISAIVELALRELFEFGLMQTDPNFANFRWQPETGRIVLLDFGATRPVPPESASHYRRLLQAGLDNTTSEVRDALLAMDYLSPVQMQRHGRELEAMIRRVLDHVHADPEGMVDFSDRGPLADVRDRAAPIIADRQGWSLPSPDKMFIQRKISGTALMCMNMNVRLPLVPLLKGSFAGGGEILRSHERFRFSGRV
ncbi:AarF/ABC1/UbiB kinase family protein [Rhizobium sp. FKY42]|uniref:ABC1 kinase family protein n=1 Tax=Rhizobium sp. FKY42 TaxID=2562310 RepID=UPI0010C00C83|nr:AarF/ABC1/UbiB kinase family protein [Rhizobium sp. FKY42]